jgi:putative ABC transport system substrate-binding protein
VRSKATENFGFWIADFGLGENYMKNLFRIRLFGSQSDNRKSKIANPKWVGFFAIVVALTVCEARVEAQQPTKIPRIGFLSSRSPDAEKNRLAAFQQGLQELGYAEGKNILIEQRYAAGKFDRLFDLASELVGLKVDVLVTTGTPAAQAAKKATRAIPVVIGNAGDPVGTGLVASLARPGGNITGFSVLNSELSGKRLELLKEVVPSVSRIAILLNPGNPINLLQVKEIQAAARPWAWRFSR